MVGLGDLEAQHLVGLDLAQVVQELVQGGLELDLVALELG